MQTSWVRGLLTGAAAAAIAALATSGAQAEPIPRLKPAPQHHSTVLDDRDFELLRDGMSAAEDASWRRVRDAADRMSDPAGAQLLRWRIATSDPSATFSELDRAMAEFAGWPRYDDIHSEAEAKIGAAGLTAAETVAWFDAHPAQSGQGFVALADALFVLGREEEGEAALKTAWRERILPTSVQNDVLARYRSRLTSEDHIARVDYLLWRDQRSAASRLYSELPQGERYLADARSRLAARARGVDTAVGRVPAALQDDPGLLYERARWRRKARRTTDALPLVLQIPDSFGPSAGPERVWFERKVHIGRALRDQDYATAYQLAAAHGLDRSVELAEAEWLAGWIALEHLGEPEQAAEHFERLDQSVSTPISKARALYWRGKAAEALNNPAAAQAFYEAASQYSVAYYGQLAATELAGAAPMPLPVDATPTEEDRATFYARPLVRATKLLAELDELRLFREFSYDLDDTLERPEEFALLAEIARSYGQDGVAVRGGKAGLARGVIEPSAVYPVIELPLLAPDAPEAAFVYAIARQESEFYARAHSRVGARGMMQLMPSTARSTARSIGASYRANWLTDDPDYNVRLGAAHLADLLDEFDGSYVLTAAAYNAGAHRARQWIAQYGDPRYGAVDPVEWVESIPFSETRDYVQRVMENTLIYRARLGDGAIAPTLDADLARSGPGN